MDKHELAVVRAEEADRVLNSELFQLAFSDTRQAIFEAWAKSERVKPEQAADLHRMIQCLDKVRRCLEEHISTGKIAQKEIEGRKRLFSFGR